MLRDRYGNSISLGSDRNVHEQAWTPGTVGVGQGDADSGCAVLLAQQAPDITHLPFDLDIHVRRRDFHRTTSRDLAQICRRDGEGCPDLIQVRKDEGVGRLADDFANGQVFLHHHGVERSSEFVTITANGVNRSTDRTDLLLGVGQGDLRFLQRLACLEVVLLRGNLVLPQLLLTLEGHSRQFDATLCGLLFAAQVRDLLARDYSEDLTLFDRLTQVGLDSLYNARNTRNHVGGPVFIEANFAREAHDCTQVTRRCSFQGNAGSLDLLSAKRQLALFFTALFAVAFFTMALITLLFGGRCGFLFVAMAIVSAMLGGTSGLLSRTVVPGKAAKSEGCHSGYREGDLAFVIHCYSC